MYHNAAVTLDWNFVLSSFSIPWVTGESASNGIYYSKNGAKGFSESKDLTEELKDSIRDQWRERGKKNFDADKLNVALADIKQ